MSRKTEDRNTVFDGAIPEHYDRHLGPPSRAKRRALVWLARAGEAGST